MPVTFHKISYNIEPHYNGTPLYWSFSSDMHTKLVALCIPQNGFDPNRHLVISCTWWRHQMETFSALLALCAGISPVTDVFPAHRPVTRSFDVRLNIRLSKQSWGQWFETPSRPLWRHCNDIDCSEWWYPLCYQAIILSTTQGRLVLIPLEGRL